MDRRLLAASAAAATLALLLAALVSAQLARPVATLAERAGHMDLDRMDVAFSTERADEIGDLSRVLDRVARRLRASAVRLRDAERRATTGDIARQVHHDVRNGLIPIRNVLAHLAEVAKEKPEAMPGIFLERQGTLDSSVAHLHALAASYAKLSPAVEREPCDVNAIVRRVAEDMEAAATVTIDVDLAADLPRVEADPVALRRILDNLTVNAVESLGGLAQGEPEGRVCIGTRSVSSNGARRVEVTVTDTGRGMTPDERVRIFDDFYTTRPGGTGLGLSIVRRLIADMNGGIEVESAPGNGTKVIVDLPARPLSLREPLPRGTTPPEAEGGEAKRRAATEGAGGLT
jgi:signal transduction histidine kinase